MVFIFPKDTPNQAGSTDKSREELRPSTVRIILRNANSSLMRYGCFQMKQFGTKLTDRVALSKTVWGIWPFRLLARSSESLGLT